MNLHLPIQFTERPCDRELIMSLIGMGLSRPESIGLMLMVWKDYAIARDERRKVPADPSIRATSPQVRIIEEYIGWKGEGGAFVEAAIQSGFLVLVAVPESSSSPDLQSPISNLQSAWLVLTDFFPANKVEATGISQQKNAAQHRHALNMQGDAMKQADEQMKLFKQTKSPVINGFAESDVGAALTIIASICRCCNLQFPNPGEWRNTLIAAAIEVKVRHKPDELTALYKWLSANRDSDLIPPRIDMILTAIPKLVDLARRDYSPGSVLDLLDEAASEC